MRGGGEGGREGVCVREREKPPCRECIVEGMCLLIRGGYNG